MQISYLLLYIVYLHLTVSFTNRACIFWFNQFAIFNIKSLNFNHRIHANTLVIPKIGARITALSTGESIRGLRHHQYRPDLIICDDIEDLSTVKFRESRDKNYNWLMGDVIPIGDINTKTVIIGNLLHEDSLMMRLKEHLQIKKDMVGTYDEFPLIDVSGRCLWPDKFPTSREIDELKLKIPDLPE